MKSKKLSIENLALVHEVFTAKRAILKNMSSILSPSNKYLSREELEITLLAFRYSLNGLDELFTKFIKKLYKEEIL